MKPFLLPLRTIALSVLATIAITPLPAYPPAPHHQIFGTARDPYGNPLTGADAEVIFESNNGREVRAPVAWDRAPGVNYRLSVPMDSGVTADLYQPGVARASAPFRLRVRLGNATYLPIEMRGDFGSLGRPGDQTRLDLTLGEDTDGDGLPDAWELALIEASGGALDLAGVRPGDDLDGDGLSNLSEYLAGTYAFDSEDGLALTLVEARDGRAVLELLALRGRSYSVRGSSDLADWKGVSFRASGEPSGVREHFTATDHRWVRFETVADEEHSFRFFRLRVE